MTLDDIEAIPKKEREQMTIRLPADLKEELQREADRSKPITLRIQNELYEELKTIAFQSGLTVTALLIAASWMHVLKLKHLPL